MDDTILDGVSPAAGTQLLPEERKLLPQGPSCLLSQLFTMERVL